MSPPRAGPDFSLHPRSTYTLLDPRSLKTIKLFQTTTFQFRLHFHPPSTNQSQNQTQPNQTVKMQFKVVAILAAMASIVAAQSTVYVTVPCSTSSISHGHASPTVVASTGVKKTPTPTGSPIAHVTGAASVNAVSGSALGLIIAGGVALLF